MKSLYPTNGQAHPLDEREHLKNTNSSMAPVPITSHLMTAINGLKTELDTGRLEISEVKEKLLEVENFAQSVQQQFKTLRQLLPIATVMRQAPDLNTLLKSTVTEVREKIISDRVSIYRFSSPSNGVVLAESSTTAWTPALGETIPALCFGRERSEAYLIEQVIAVNDSNHAELTPYQRQLWEKFQIKASLSIPILVGTAVSISTSAQPAQIGVWGLLVVNNCSSSRQWQEAEIVLLHQIATELSQALERFEFQTQLQQQQSREKSVAKVIDKIRQSADVDDIFKTTTQEVRQLLQADRIAVYRFNPDWSGEFVAESVASGWRQLVGPNIKTVWEDTHLQETQGGRYRYHEVFVANDIYQVGHSPCHLEILEQFEVKAYAIAPVFAGKKLWGLLAAYQNSSPRHWQAPEISLLAQIGVQFGVALSQAEYLEQVRIKSEQLAQVAEQEQALTKVVNRIRQSLDLDAIFRTTTLEVRQLLQCDRVAVYRFNSDWSGEFVAESVGSGWVRLVGPDIKTVWEDTHLQATQGGRYAKGEIFAVDDIDQMGHARCHLDVLEQFEVKAYLIVPVFSGQKLWGLLAAYQNSGSRHWQASEISLLDRIGVQFSVAVLQAEYLEQVEAQSRRLARIGERQGNLISLTRKIGEAIISKVPESQESNAILKTTSQSVRQLLQVDRVAVYQFNSDWSGEFVAESVSTGWTPLMEKQFDNSKLQEVTDCSIQRLTEGNKVKDTYLQATQGGRYHNKEIYVVDDIYKAGFSPCYLELLEQFEAKAYLTVPIFKGQKLWGLLATYQNSASRHWEEFEVNVLHQIGILVGVALQQADYLKQLQAQSEQLEQSAERLQLLNKIIERIRQSLDLDTLFRSTAREARRLLSADRVGVFRFDPGYAGKFVAEDVLAGYVSALNFKVEDHCFASQYASSYREGRIQAVADIYDANLTDCHIDILSQFQIRANLIVPLLKGNELWGLLCIHQCSEPRQWQDQEIGLIQQIAQQFGVALQQAEYLQQLQAQSQQLAEAAQREKGAKELLQQRAMQLLGAVRPALDGDLTVRAPITEDELGTIADAYNNTLQALRQIVMQVQTAAQQVAQTSSQSDASLVGLTNLAQRQSQESTQALEQIQQMVNSTQAVVANAELVETALLQANHTVECGDAAMNRTVEGIQAIRETVAQTSKKIKRLSESSQKISKVVNLIGGFATQTNVLALNAAIEATRAGEYGKGFAVVADEVRSLSRQSAIATTEIEQLMQEIKAETGEVAAAMETGIQQVVEGTNLVNETRLSLNAIITATAQISQLVQGITQTTQVQTQQSVSVIAAMTDVTQFAQQTSVESIQISDSFKELLAMAQELLASAVRFKVN